jgi:hypothetical protein
VITFYKGLNAKGFVIDCQTIVGSHRNDASNALVVGVQIQQT